MRGIEAIADIFGNFGRPNRTELRAAIWRTENGTRIERIRAGVNTEYMVNTETGSWDSEISWKYFRTSKLKLS